MMTDYRWMGLFASMLIAGAFAGCSAGGRAVEAPRRDSYRYKTTGLYEVELLKDKRVAWTERDARFLMVFDRANPRLKLYSPNLPGVRPQKATVRLDNAIYKTFTARPGEWTTLDIPHRPGRHCSVVSIAMERVHRVAGPGSRELGLAIDLGEINIPSRR